MVKRDQWRLLEQFGALALLHPNAKITNLYNWFIRQIPKEDMPFMSKNFVMFLTAAEDARKAPEDIKKELTTQFQKS